MRRRPARRKLCAVCALDGARRAGPHVYIATPAPHCGVAMIVAGMDVSGDQRSGNHKFMSLVFGTQESLDAITRRLGSEQIHMNMIKNQKTRNDIIRQVRFDGIECIGFCMRLEKAQTIARVKKLVGRKHRPSVGKIYKAYHFLVWRRIRDRIEEFLRHHDCEVRSIRFQCDADCRDFTRDVGWQYVDGGPAYMLADVVAWANSRGREPTGTVP